MTSPQVLTPLPRGAEAATDRRWTTPLELAVLALLVTALTVICWRVFPLADDGMHVMAIRHGGGEAVFDTQVDRPLLGRIWQWQVDHGIVWKVATAVHWLSWFGMGWVTWRLWRVLFPASGWLALPAACLAVAPLICRTQTWLFTAPVTGTTGPVLAWLAILPFLSPAAKDRRVVWTVILLVLMAAAVGLPMLISEYPAPAATAGAVLIFLLAPRPRQKLWPVIATLLVLAAATTVGYMVYHYLGNPARGDIRPELQDWGWRAKVLAPRWLMTLWKMSGGLILERFSDLGTTAPKPALLGLAVGLIGAAGLSWISSRRGWRSAESAAELEQGLRTPLALVAALAAGLMPVVGMGHGAFGTWLSTRFTIPLLPVAACLSVYLLGLIVRPRLRWLVPAICGLLAGYFIVVDGIAAIQEREQVVAMGDQLQAYVPDTGLTVAIIHRHWSYMVPYPMECELTPRLMTNWPEAKRDHFWAFAGMDAVFDRKVTRDGKSDTMLFDPFGPKPLLLRDWWMYFRPLNNDYGPVASGQAATTRAERPPKAEEITNLLWVTEDVEGQIHVESLFPRKPESP